MNNLFFLCIIALVMNMRNYPVVKINKRASIKEESLHPWIFDNEIDEIKNNFIQEK